MIGALVLGASIVEAGASTRAEPLVQQEGKLVAGDSTLASGQEAHFGASAALSSDGSMLLVGAPADNSARGAAWVFVHGAGGGWVTQAGDELTPGTPPAGNAGACSGASESCEECAEESPATAEEEECAFGTSVAISADGDTAIVGNPTDSSTPGAAWVFTREGESWSRTAVLTGEDAGGEGGFGKSVALSADGDTALVGDPSAATGRGSAWLFVREGSTWTLQKQLYVPGIGVARFGRSVALSGGGSLALVGAPGENERAGAAWTFERSGSSWSQQSNELTEEDGQAGDRFGRGVALSADGSTAWVGAPLAEEGRGSASPFVISADGFVSQGGRFVGPAGQQHFGASVTLSGDGDYALVGAPRATAEGGTVSQLERSGSSWQENEEELLAAAGAKSRSMFGSAVALSTDGKVAAIGSSRDSGRLGAAWVFVEGEPPPPIIESIAPTSGPSSGGTSVTIKGENLERAIAVSFGGEPAASFKAVSAAELTAVTPAGAPGSVEVAVTTPNGTSVAKRKFVYEATSSGSGPVGGGGGTTTGKTTTSVQQASGGVAGFAAATDPTCTVSLRKKRLAVTRYRTVALRLVRTGTGACRGKLAISYRTRAKGRGYMLRTIGTASFSIAAGTSRVVQVKLTKAGVAWFRAHHGKANASVAIARVLPAPVTASSASVRLSLKKRPKRSSGK